MVNHNLYSYVVFNIKDKQNNYNCFFSIVKKAKKYRLQNRRYSRTKDDKLSSVPHYTEQRPEQIDKIQIQT